MCKIKIYDRKSSRPNILSLDSYNFAFDCNRLREDDIPVDSGDQNSGSNFPPISYNSLPSVASFLITDRPLIWNNLRRLILNNLRR